MLILKTIISAIQKFLAWPPKGLLVLVFVCAPGLCAAVEKPVGILLSREISPYVAMVSGLEMALGSQPVQRFFLDEKGTPFTLTGRESILTPENYSALVAVGPEALNYLQNSDTAAVPLFYGMVLNPQNLSHLPSKSLCGVALNLPVEVQIAALLRQLPALRRLGILFDPENNQSWFERAQQVAMQYEIELLALQAQRVNGRIELVGEFSGPDALMFIPDKSIISQVMIQYVIKQAVLQRIPAIGYNQFFLDSGAALAFVIDYQGIGQQVAHQIESVFAGQECAQAVPSFQLRSNPQVWQALGLPVSKEAP